LDVLVWLATVCLLVFDCAIASFKDCPNAVLHKISVAAKNVCLNRIKNCFIEFSEFMGI
jgi:hypothetical protein